MFASLREVRRVRNRRQDEVQAPGSYEMMQDLMKGFEERQVKGFLFNAVYRSESDPDEVWLIVGFEDEASYRANAEDRRPT